MKLYIAKWPDNTLTIVTASSKRDLFFKLDEEGDASSAKISCVSFDDDIHITTAFAGDGDDRELVWHLGDYCNNAKTRKVKIA